MNIFSVVLIPTICCIYFLIRKEEFKVEWLYAVIASVLVAIFIFLFEFPIFWVKFKEVSPLFTSLFSFSLASETLVPMVFMLLGYWLFRGKIWKKNEELEFFPIFIYFAIIFYSLNLAENIYYRFDTNFYQVILGPISKVLMLFISAFIIYLAEQLENRVVSLFLVFLILIYSLLISFNYAIWYSANNFFLILTYSLLAIPLGFLLFLLPQSLACKNKKSKKSSS